MHFLFKIALFSIALYGQGLLVAADDKCYEKTACVVPYTTPTLPGGGTEPNAVGSQMGTGGASDLAWTTASDTFKGAGFYFVRWHRVTKNQKKTDDEGISDYTTGASTRFKIGDLCAIFQVSGPTSGTYVDYVEPGTNLKYGTGGRRILEKCHEPKL